MSMNANHKMTRNAIQEYVADVCEASAEVEAVRAAHAAQLDAMWLEHAESEHVAIFGFNEGDY